MENGKWPSFVLTSNTKMILNLAWQELTFQMCYITLAHDGVADLAALGISEMVPETGGGGASSSSSAQR